MTALAAPARAQEPVPLPDELFDRDVDLESRQWPTDAAVHSPAPADVLIVGPLELIGARLGMIHGNRSTTKEARASFWDETLVPLYQEIAAVLTLGLRDEYGDFDYLEFDLSTVKALQEDETAKVDRIVKQLHGGVISVQEARVDLGREPDFEAGAILVMPDNVSGLPADQLDAPPAPAPALGGANTSAATVRTNGALTPREREVLGV